MLNSKKTKTQEEIIQGDAELQRNFESEEKEEKENG